MAESKKTTNHDTIKKWVDERNGKPSTVKGTVNEGEHTGLLRIDFPGYSGEETLEEVSWDEFFDQFEKSKLAFLYQEKTEDGNESRFNKFISREGN